MANKLHSGKVGPRLRPTEQCLLRRFFQALFQPPCLPDPPRRVSVSLFLFFSPLSLPGPFLRFLIPHPRAPLPSPRALGGRAKDRRSGRGEKVGSLADFSASTRVHRYLSITLPLLGVGEALRDHRRAPAFAPLELPSGGKPASRSFAYYLLSE